MMGFKYAFGAPGRRLAAARRYVDACFPIADLSARPLSEHGHVVDDKGRPKRRGNALESARLLLCPVDIACDLLIVAPQP